MNATEKKCFCGRPLTVRQLRENLWKCDCKSCLRASEHDGEVIYVIGFGSSPEAAGADWDASQTRF